MSQSSPEKSSFTVYGGGTPEQIQKPILGQMDVPDTYNGSGSEFLKGKSWPAEKIEYPSRLGGHALIFVEVNIGGVPIENYLREKVEGIFTPYENLGDTATAEG